jgi:hypothetical protein
MGWDISMGGCIKARVKIHDNFECTNLISSLDMLKRRKENKVK